MSGITPSMDPEFRSLLLSNSLPIEVELGGKWVAASSVRPRNQGVVLAVPESQETQEMFLYEDGRACTPDMIHLFCWRTVGYRGDASVGMLPGERARASDALRAKQAQAAQEVALQHVQPDSQTQVLDGKPGACEGADPLSRLRSAGSSAASSSSTKTVVSASSGGTGDRSAKRARRRRLLASASEDARDDSAGASAGLNA
jgi:hypothetical protein